MYYIVLFEEANVIGTVKKDWLLNDQQCKYPPIKEVNKCLKSRVKNDTSGWNVYKIVLKKPKQLGHEGVETLKLARDMEKFYEKFSDTDDYERTSIQQKYLKLHPTLKLQKEDNFNKFVPLEIQSSVSMERTNSSESSNAQSSDQKEDPNEDPEQVSNQEYQIEYLEEVIETEDDQHLGREFTNQMVTNVDCRPESSNLQLMAVCEEILKNISSINDRIASMDKRLSTLELHILKKVDLDNFCFDMINSLKQLEEFLKKVDGDAEFKQKLIYFLYVNCGKGNAKKYQNGVVKKILTTLFDNTFLNTLGWSTEKSTTSAGTQDQRIHLCEYKSFQNICLEVLNYSNPNPLFQQNDVAAGLKEFFKRLARN